MLRVLAGICLISVLVLPIASVFANWAAPAVIVSDLEATVIPTASEEGITFQPDDQTFVAEGRHWIFYLNEDADFTYKSALSDGVFGAETDLVATTLLYGWEIAVFYDEVSNTVHYARHDMTPAPDEIKYRMGTPNADGTITWAAIEQTVHTTPAVLDNWRIAITVDEEGYPWIAWIDTNGVDIYGIVYVESSSTKNGVWTTVVGASEEFDDADYHAWFVSLTPVDDDKQVQVAWSMEDITGGGDDGEMQLQSCLYDDDTGWDAQQQVLPSGELYTTRPDAFDFYDHGSAMWVVYTDGSGNVDCGARSQIQNWAEASWGVVKTVPPGLPYIPTISAMRMNPSGAGEDLICIMHCAVEIGYKVHTHGDDMNTWSDFVTAWTVPDIANDVISRHIATYKYLTGTSLLSFAWQWQDFSADPDPLDTVQYWWIDQDQLGYYAGGLPDIVVPFSNLIPLIFLGMGILVLLVLAFAEGIDLKSLIIMAIAISLLLAFLVMINAQVNSF
jgi:hypothetical protein